MTSPFKVSGLSNAINWTRCFEATLFQRRVAVLPPMKRCVILDSFITYVKCSGVKFSGIGIILIPNERQARSTKVPL